MNSLGSKLFTALLALYLLTASVSTVVSYRQYATSVNAFMDGQIHALAIAGARQLASSGAPALSRSLEMQNIQHHGTPIEQIWTATGRLSATSYPMLAVPLQSNDGFNSIRTREGSWRTYTLRAGSFVVQVAQSNDFRRRVILDSTWNSVAPVAVLIPLSALLLWFAVYWALRPVDRIVGAITRQGARDLAELPTAGVPRELLPLITSMNGLIVRVREAFVSQRHFVQDAAHELRTPLAACMLQAEGARRHPGNIPNTELTQLQSGLRRMQRLIDQLLLLAREDAEHPEYALEPVDVEELLKSCIGDLIPLAEQRNVDLGITGTEACHLSASSSDLRSILDNLLDNAVRYSPPGGHVDVLLRAGTEAAVVEIADTGPGVPAESLDRVFDRFFRVPGTGVEGNGIGLAIVRSAANRGGITVELTNRKERNGLLARISIPSPGLSLI